MLVLSQYHMHVCFTNCTCSYFEDEDEQNGDDLEYQPAPGSPGAPQDKGSDSDEDDDSDDPLEAFMEGIEVSSSVIENHFK